MRASLSSTVGTVNSVRPTFMAALTVSIISGPMSFLRSSALSLNFRSLFSFRVVPIILLIVSVVNVFVASIWLQESVYRAGDFNGYLAASGDDRLPGLIGMSGQKQNGVPNWHGNDIGRPRTVCDCHAWPDRELNLSRTHVR